jgi:hypothetical protein
MKPILAEGVKPYVVRLFINTFGAIFGFCEDISTNVFQLNKEYGLFLRTSEKKLPGMVLTKSTLYIHRKDEILEGMFPYLNSMHFLCESDTAYYIAVQLPSGKLIYYRVDKMLPFEPTSLIGDPSIQLAAWDLLVLDGRLLSKEEVFNYPRLLVAAQKLVAELNAKKEIIKK